MGSLFCLVNPLHFAKAKHNTLIYIDLFYLRG